MEALGAHFTLTPGSINALILHWVYDPRRAIKDRQGAAGGPSIEDSSTVTVNVTAKLLGDFPPMVTLAMPDLYATVEWSSGGKDVQRVEFDCLHGASVSFAAARAAVYCSYTLDPSIDPATMPDIEVNVSLGRQTTGHQRPKRTIQCGTLAPLGNAVVQIPPFADTVSVIGDVSPLVVLVSQNQGNLYLAGQNVTSSTDQVPVHPVSDQITILNNGAGAGRFAAQFQLAL